MSQKKIDQYKKDKYDRKKHPSKQSTTSYGAYFGVCAFAVLFVVWIGYSILLQFNLLPQKEEKVTFPSAVTAEQLAKTLATNDVFGCYTTAASENEGETTTVADKSEETTTAGDKSENTTEETSAE